MSCLDGHKWPAWPHALLTCANSVICMNQVYCLSHMTCKTSVTFGTSVTYTIHVTGVTYVIRIIYHKSSKIHRLWYPRHTANAIMSCHKWARLDFNIILLSALLTNSETRDRLGRVIQPKLSSSEWPLGVAETVYVKVWDHGPISLNYLFLAVYPHLKVTQLFFKVFNLPEYMVRWCGEQFCEQVLLCRPLCCQKTPHSTPTFVHL